LIDRFAVWDSSRQHEAPTCLAGQCNICSWFKICGHACVNILAVYYAVSFHCINQFSVIFWEIPSDLRPGGQLYVQILHGGMQAQRRPFADDGADNGGAFFLFGDIARLKLLVIGLNLFQSFGQVDPELDAGRVAVRKLGMDNASSRRKTLCTVSMDGAFIAKVVFMPHTAGKEICDGLKATMRMIGKAAVFDIKMILQYERVEIAHAVDGHQPFDGNAIAFGYVDGRMNDNAHSENLSISSGFTNPEYFTPDNRARS